MVTTVRLQLPPKWDGEPSWIEREYPSRTFDFDTAERAASGEKHRALFVAIGEAKRENRCGWFRCTCRDDVELEVMVRLRERPYLALMPGTSLDHASACAFYREPITSHVSAAIERRKNGTLNVRLNFRLGEPAPEREPVETPLNEAPLRARQAPQRQLNKFGLDGLLRLLFSEAGLHRWPRKDRTAAAAATAGSWKPTYARLLQTLGRIDAQGQRPGALKAYTRIGTPGTVAAFAPGTVIALVDVIEKVEPSKYYNWKCYLAGWGENFLIISPAQVEALLGRLRFHQKKADTILAKKQTALPRPTEVWWGCLLVRVEEGEHGKWYRVLDHAALRADRHGIPAESLDEITMTQHLIEAGRAFCKPLFPGELLAARKRRPDFILEDTAEPCCIEVAGMSDVYDYNDRDDERLDEYDKAGVKYRRWKPGDPWPVLDGDFRKKQILAPSGAPPSARPS